MITDSTERGLAASGRYRGGFTLVELVVGMAVTSVIMLAVGSTMLIAGRALPDARSPVVASVAGAGTLEQMVTELQYAVSIAQRTAGMIEFAVADRDGDDIPETIRYEWSGTAGQPLTRCYNAGTAVTILQDVREFGLSYDLKTIAVELPQANESGQTTLATHTATLDLHDYPVKDTEWYAQYFLPALPADATGWRVTGVVIQAKQDGATDGEARVQLQLPTAGNCPSGIVLEEKTLLESALLAGYLEQEFTFADTDNLSPQEGICIVVKWMANGTACKLRGRDKNVTATHLTLAKSTNRGASWSVLGAQSLLFTVYGTVTTSGTPQVQNTYRLDTVGITLRAGSDSQSMLHTAARTLNQPEVNQ